MGNLSRKLSQSFQLLNLEGLFFQVFTFSNISGYEHKRARVPGMVSCQRPRNIQGKDLTLFVAVVHFIRPHDPGGLQDINFLMLQEAA